MPTYGQNRTKPNTNLSESTGNVRTYHKELHSMTTSIVTYSPEARRKARHSHLTLDAYWASARGGQMKFRRTRSRAENVFKATAKVVRNG